MRIAIVGVCDQRHMSLISLYTEYFDSLDIAYDIVCIDRYDNIDTNYNQGGNVYAYKFPSTSNRSNLVKLLYFMKFRNYVKHIFDMNNYDYVVVWNENTIVLIADYLLHRYGKRYCVNIRDYNWKLPTPLNPLRLKVIENACFTTVPSPEGVRLLKGLPNVTLMVSKNDKVLNCVEPHKRLVDKSGIIRISYIGKVRFTEQDMDLIDAFANDDRYLLQFIGSGSEKYSDYILQNDIRNVKLIGEFNPSDTYRFLNDTDVINAFYDAENGNTALPIKFQFSPSLKIPCLVANDSFMGKIGTEYGFAFPIDRNQTKSVPDMFYTWYHSLDFDSFSIGCAQFLAWVEETNRNWEAKLSDSLFCNESL